MNEDKKKDTKVEEKIVVVAELPTQQINKVITESNESLSLITITDALTEMYHDIKEIKKIVA
jgi:hypothetical protein